MEKSFSGTVWVVTGAAGFIGSHLSEYLLRQGATVRGLDNLITGKERNLDVLREVDVNGKFTFHRGSITDKALLGEVFSGVDYVLHQAALGSVPRSIEHPLNSHDANVNGFINVLDAARRAGVKRTVYASSSSVYGDSPTLPKQEGVIGKPLSPYAATKLIDEIYAAVFARSYEFSAVGLRYFNVFGARQDPEGAYAAVIPRWFQKLYRGEAVSIYGDGETSRDFCYIANVVQANIKAATAELPAEAPAVFNVAAGQRTTLTELFEIMRQQVTEKRPDLNSVPATYEGFRSGDVRHSLADISAAQKWLGYHPTHSLVEGLKEAAEYYGQHYGDLK
jgi:UDP-N-acetylglucosamine 4-epimerase